MYFQCQSNKSSSTGRKTTIVSYAVYLLYVLATLNFVLDLVALVLEVSSNSICSKNIIFLISCADTYQVTDFFHWNCPKHSKRVL